MNIQALDGDGHVEEWEATFSDDYLEPEFRDRRPEVIVWDDGDFEIDYAWLVEGRKLRLGGSPSSKDGAIGTEYARMRPWRGPLESAEMHSAADRLAVMDEEGIAVSVNYPTLMLLWPLAEDPALNRALTRSYNNWIADVSSQAPDRLKWVSMIDPSDPAEAAREIERTKELGAVGIVAFGNYNGRGLDDPDFHPIWSTAQDTGMPVNVHPGFAAMDALRDYPAVAADQFLTSVVRGFKTIMSSGLLDRYPGVTVSFQETGCTWVDFAIEDMSFMLDNVNDRIKMNALRREHHALIERGLPEMKPHEYIDAGRVYIGFEVDDELLPYMVDKYGVSCWTFASDIPHTHRKRDAARMLLDRDDLADDVKRRLVYEGTSRLYGIPAPQLAVPTA